MSPRWLLFLLLATQLNTVTGNSQSEIVSTFGGWGTDMTILTIIAFLISYVALAIFVGKCIKFGSEQDHEVPHGGLQRDPPAIVFFRTHPNHHQ